MPPTLTEAAESLEEFKTRCSVLDGEETVELPLAVDAGPNLLVRDMLDVLEEYRAKGWVTDVDIPTTRFWSRELLTQNVHDAHGNTLEEIQDRRVELERQLAALKGEEDNALQILAERLKTIEGGKIPWRAAHMKGAPS